MGRKKTKYGREQEGYCLLKIEKDIVVTDDWYPCFEGNKVHISMFVTNVRDSKFVRICAWGADDFGVELDYKGPNFESLVWHYDFWKTHLFDKIPNNIDVNWFYEHGFYPA